MDSLFKFIQIAIGAREPFAVAATDDDWEQLFRFCKRQTLVGIGFTAIEKLHRHGVECPKALMMRWMAMTLQIEKRNEKLNRQCKTLTEQFEHDGLRCCILKGQGNLLNYPEELNKQRIPGDIDVWTVVEETGIPIAAQTGKNDVGYITYRGKRGVIEYIRMQHRLKKNDKDIELRYQHIEAPKIDETPVEVHFRVGFCNSPLRNIRMQRWFERHADECMKNKTYMGFSVPTASVNVVYQMTHIFSHYFDEGIGLRQLLDYYFVIKLWHNDTMEVKDIKTMGMWSEGLGTHVMSANEIIYVLKRFGMAKFASAVMWVLQRVFAMPDEWLICAPDEKRGQQLLSEIMQSGNFGQYDERGKEMKHGGTIFHGIWKLKRITRLVRFYPEEALCEPLFRVWHWGWRCLH